MNVSLTLIFVPVLFWIWICCFRPSVDCHIHQPTRSIAAVSCLCLKLTAVSIRSTARICVCLQSFFLTIRHCTMMWNRFSSTFWRWMMSLVATWLATSQKKNTANRSTMCHVSWQCHSISARVMAATSSILVSHYFALSSKICWFWFLLPLRLCSLVQSI